jgi:hypothetical protein
VLHILELALDTFLSIASDMLVLAQVLGTALCMCDDGVVFGYGSELALGTCYSRLVAYYVSHSVDVDSA